MPLFDLPLEELRSYLPERGEPDDFADFWKRTLEEARTHPLDPELRPADPDLALVEVCDLTFSGADGHRVRGWFLRPRGVPGPQPCVVRFLGYGDGRGAPLDWLTWPASGYACLVMDTRGQGATARRAGATADPAGGTTAQAPGFLTRGVLDPADYYYRRVFTDAVRAVEVARSHPAVDPDRVAVQGMSQGGGIALAAAALAGGVSAALVDVPFLCHFSRAVEITERAPYAELLAFLRTHRDQAGRALATLRYFDGMTMAAHADVPALFSVALMDDVCPPSTVFAAYNHYAGPKEIDVWPYNMHEGGGVHQEARQLRWLHDRWS